MVFDFLHGLAQIFRVQASGNHDTNDIGAVVICMDFIAHLPVLIEVDDLEKYMLHHLRAQRALRSTECRPQSSLDIGSFQDCLIGQRPSGEIRPV
jgi:hypothetical protein